MCIKTGDKVICKSNSFFMANEGDIFDVSDVDGNYVYMEREAFSHVIDFTIDRRIFDTHFEKYEEPKPEPNPVVVANKVTSKMVKDILDNSDIMVDTLFDKCTLVAVKLPNGFVITETSSCVDPANYDEELGYKVCMKRIEDKVWELEGYLLQNKIYETNAESDYLNGEDGYSDWQCYKDKNFNCDNCVYASECF